MTDIQKLFKKLRNDKIEYPDGMFPIYGGVHRPAFFPGGKGTSDNSESLLGKDIMILGQDFGDYDGFIKSTQNEHEDFMKNATWRNIKLLFDDVGLSLDKGFYTNAIMGVRIGNQGVGKSPAFLNEPFIKYCREFFKFQVELNNPKLVIVCGKLVAQFLSGINKKLMVWEKISGFKVLDENGYQIIRNVQVTANVSTNFVLIVHPCMRIRNVKIRGYNGLHGNPAEVAMIKNALN
jgi:uracil-DNA glycosylase